MSNHPSSENSGPLKHLARLSDFIFALAMALTFWQFDLPDQAHLMSSSEINQFLIGQLRPLSNYLITFVLVAMYWIAHTQQFSYYKRTNEVHLWIYAMYLMCLFLVPYTNELAMTFPGNAFAKVSFAIDIALIGLLSFASWWYATHQARLVDIDLDDQTIITLKIKALVEPICALIAILIASIAPDWSDLAWISFPVIHFVLKRWFARSTEAGQITQSIQ